MDHEQAAIESFFEPPRAQRLLALLRKPRGRRQLLQQLSHPKGLRPACLTRIPGHQQNVKEILRLLESLGAPRICHVLSGASALDGRLMPLEEALPAVIGCGQGTLLSCLPGRVGYLETEEKGERFLLLSEPR